MLHKKLGNCIICDSDVALETYMMNKNKLVCHHCMAQEIEDKFWSSYNPESTFDVMAQEGCRPQI